MMIADSLAKLMQREEDDEEDECAAVDDGRCPHVEDARAREDEDNGDRAQTEADAGSHEAASNETWCDVGGRSREADLKAAGHTTWQARLIALLRIGTAPRRHVSEIHYRCRIVILKYFDESP